MARPSCSSGRRLRQRGAVGVLGALWFGIAVTCLMAIDLGHLFWQQREVQRIADLSALAGADAEQSTCAAHAVDNAGRNGLRTSGASADVAIVQCGNWNPRTGSVGQPSHDVAQYFQENRSPFNAARVRIERRVPYFFLVDAGQSGRTVVAIGTGARAMPRAALTIRSTLLAVDNGLLNAVLGGMLGGAINVSAVGWQGLLLNNIRLLDYIDRLGINLGIGAGQVDQVLAANARVNDLLQAAIDVLQLQAPNATTIDAVVALQALQAAAPGSPSMRLGDLLSIQANTPPAALQLNLQAFQLAQAVVQLANAQSGASVDVPLLSLPGLADIRLKAKVVEPPQFSIGNAEMARLDPLGPNAIRTRTAQVRTLLTANVPALSAVSGLVGAVGTLLAPVTGLLNSVLSLDLGSILCLVTCNTTETRAVPVPGNVNLSVYLEVAHAEAHVTDVDCRTASRSITAEATTAAALLRVGSMTAAQQSAALASSVAPVMGLMPVLDVETRKCTKTLLGLIWSCDPWAPYSRTGVGADTQVAAHTETAVFANPPEINQPTVYRTFGTTSVVSSLASTLAGLKLQTYKYNPAATNAMGDLVGTATQLVAGASAAVQTLVTVLLAPLLNRLVDVALKTLGIDLAQVGVGANLSCGQDVELVH